MCGLWRWNCYAVANQRAQGFDEFMNLVVDDAVEVRLATKSEEEKRRNLGSKNMCLFVICNL